MGNNKKRIYTEEFREEAVKLITKQGYKPSEAAINLGINANMLRKWKNNIELKKSNTSADIETREENRRLKAEIKRLKMEREILKKAAAFFAKETN